uniref:Uncharacterized protein n=1 Tax=Moniliophthora roreri TaxID=221103 RepID=A0A0W0G303_MONRR
MAKIKEYEAFIYDIFLDDNFWPRKLVRITTNFDSAGASPQPYQSTTFTRSPWSPSNHDSLAFYPSLQVSPLSGFHLNSSSPTITTPSSQTKFNSWLKNSSTPPITEKMNINTNSYNQRYFFADDVEGRSVYDDYEPMNSFSHDGSDPEHNNPPPTPQYSDNPSPPQYPDNPSPPQHPDNPSPPQQLYDLPHHDQSLTMFSHNSGFAILGGQFNNVLGDQFNSGGFYVLNLPQSMHFNTGFRPDHFTIDGIPIFLYQLLSHFALSLDLSVVQLLLLLTYHSFEPQIIQLLSGTSVQQLLTRA